MGVSSLTNRTENCSEGLGIFFRMLDKNKNRIFFLVYYNTTYYPSREKKYKKLTKERILYIHII